ncbi:MAG: hypothetical protein FWE45_02600 [Firmicutes bacterium]|nr:hypothetical protein [Bacillota bacterium]
MDKELIESLRKLAIGYFEEEIEITDDKQKRKIKYHAPKIEAIRELGNIKPKENRFEFMSHDQLIAEVERILEELRRIE